MLLSFFKYCTVDKIFDRTSFSLADVSLLATSFTGVFPNKLCNRSIEDPSSTLRLECPLNCDSMLDNVTIDSDASNDCGGLGSRLCSNYFEWLDDIGRGCDFYEQFDNPGCRATGDMSPKEDGITANDACCYCGGGECNTTCFDATDDECTNDNEWTAIVGNETISCDWFEDNDEPGCVNTYAYFLMADVSDPRGSCCYCSEYCQDLPGWRDVRVHDDYGYVYGWRGWECDWYEEWDEPGCPLYGDKWPDDDGITAREACCYCHGYDPDSAPPACYDYNGWEIDGLGCEGYELVEDPGCPYYGDCCPDEDGITGIDACCYCGGGGSMNIPSAYPSSKYAPTVTPSVTPTDKPSHQYEPTVTPSVTPTDKPSHQYEPTVTPTVTCYDYNGWVENCDLLETNDDPGCPRYGGIWADRMGMDAYAACCYCGGGWFAPYNEDDVNDQCDDNDIHWQNIASTIYLPSNHQSCDELEYYISILDNQVGSGVGLTEYYCNMLHNGTVFMKDVCCICNPNQNDEPTFNDDESSCVDIQIPKPWPQRNCEWFARDVSHCQEFGASTILIEGDSNVPQRSANDVCCVCGGGTRECLEFNDNWMDSHPDEPFNCSQYDSEERCAADGSGLISFGHNANTQCCICGGGYTFRNNNVIVNATNQTCLDESDWQSNNLTCSSFVDKFGAPDVEQCLALGHITSIHGVNASEGCCECWYGYDADTGGGYQGMLIGEMFRIGMMNYTDLEYVHNVTSSSDVEEDSTLYEFVRNASKFYGFGLVHYDMNELRKTRGLGRISNDAYHACLDGECILSCDLKYMFSLYFFHQYNYLSILALSLSLVDVCIGKSSCFCYRK